MNIPDNIKQEDILKAIKKIDEEGIPANAHSSTYDVLFNNKRYPPKLVVSYANLFAYGKELDRTEFPGGKDTQCFDILRTNGFEIIEKKRMNFLKDFLKQADTKDLKTTNYIKSYNGLDVKVSFGQGNQARIPWIAFLVKGQEVSNGIYPVYLLFKEYKKLILAYGVSETETPTHHWNIDNVETIKDYFSKCGIKPPRYGSSYVYKVYEIDDIDNWQWKKLEEDLDNIIEKYKEQLENQTITKDKESIVEFSLDSLYKDIKETGLYFQPNLVKRFVTALATKPFVILTGLSGSGKTKLAQAFSKWICEDPNKQTCIIPVGADWTNKEMLLGYPNALEKGKYVSPENGALELLIEASKQENRNKPYFLILDEMNLSHVERYFAEFLSAMESAESITLHPNNEDVWKECSIPSRISLPKNLFIIGTINVDETTYMFSPKVLDRANVIEFRVAKEDMRSFLNNHPVTNLNSIDKKGCNMASSFLELVSNNNTVKEEKELEEILFQFFSELKKIGAEFGFRSAAEIYRFFIIAHTIDKEWSTEQIIDTAIIQKILPKIHGSRRKLEPVLKLLAQLCVENNEALDISGLLIGKVELESLDGKLIKYPLSLDKIIRMNKGLMDNGFTSYAEA